METKDTKIKNIIKCTAKAAITIEATNEPFGRKYGKANVLHKTSR